VSVMGRLLGDKRAGRDSATWRVLDGLERGRNAEVQLVSPDSSGYMRRPHNWIRRHQNMNGA
jgi:hypothetical protein